MALLRHGTCIAAAALAAGAAVVPAWAGPSAGAPERSAGAAAKPPRIEQMVAYRGSKMQIRKVRALATTVRVAKRRRCAVAAGTPLAALVRSKPGKILYEDFGSCSRGRARDAAGLFVRSIRGQRNVRQDGWVYKVGRKLGTAGVADPAGPFGNGRLRAGQRLLWFYCVYTEGSCQRTLEMRIGQRGAGVVDVLVRGFDDAGRGVAVEDAKVTAGAASAITGADGRASLTLTPGLHVLYASKPGTIRSFGERVTVR